MNSTENRSAKAERRLHGQYWNAEPDGSVTLNARQCTSCGAAYLPSIVTCISCRGNEFRALSLTATGELYSYTIVRGNGGVWPDLYAIGYVDFPREKVRVCGHLAETDPARIKIGMKVKCEEAVLYMDANGVDVTCYRFRGIEDIR